MTTLHVAAGPLPAGGAAAHRVRETLLALRGDGDRAHLLVAGDDVAIHGIESISLSRKGSIALLGGSPARDRLRDLSPDGPPAAVHAHGVDAARAGRDLARELGVALVVDLIAPPAAGKGESLLAGADRLVTPSASLARALAAASDRALHLPGSIDPADLPPSPQAPYRIPPGKTLVIVFAPLAGEDPDPLLAAFETLLSREGDLHLVVMGHPIGVGFLQAVSAHHMVPQITFGGLPPLAQAARLVAQARGVLFALADPGLVEPYAALSIAAGAPILAADGPDARDFFEGSAEYAPGRDGPLLGNAALAAFGNSSSAVRPPRGPGRHARAAFAGRLRALYAGVGPR